MSLPSPAAPQSAVSLAAPLPVGHRLDLAAIEAAARALDGIVIKTPCLPSPRLSALTGANVWVKYENLQATGSFKDRGAFVKMLTLKPDERSRGVIAMSAGNHAQAVAYHAARLGIRATIVMPERTPFVKIAATEAHGAEIVLAGETLAESGEHCAEIAARDNLVLIHPYDDPAIIAGQGTVALEMLTAVPDLDCVVVPIGGGGLIGGIATAAKALRPAIEVIGVEAALFASAAAALAGEARIFGGATLAEGIAVKHPGAHTLPIIRELVSDIVVVGEDAIERAVNAYLTQQKVMAEGAGAAGLAAMLTEPARFRGRTVGLVLCGGNIDPRLLAGIMVRELARDKRIVTVEARFVDEPGVLSRLTGAVADARGNILEVAHDRLGLSHLARETSCRLTIETRDDAHTVAVLDALRATGIAVELAGNVDARF